MYKWGIKSGPTCDCGADKQTTEHIVIKCAKRTFYETLAELNA